MSSATTEATAGATDGATANGTDGAADGAADGATGGATGTASTATGGMGIRDLFHFVDFTDKCLLTVGTIGYVIAGAAGPALFVLFGNSVDRISSPSMSKYLKDFAGFLGLGLINMVSNFLGYWAVETSCARQMAVWKKAYITSILRQDVDWYDTNKPEELSARMGESMVLLGKGLGRFCWGGISVVSGGITGVVISMFYLWDLSLVIVALCPISILALAWVLSVEAASAKAILEAYSQAGGVLTDILSALKTVASFGMEPTSKEKYAKYISAALAAGLKKTWGTGISYAFNYASSFYILAIGMLYVCLQAAAERRRTTFAFINDDIHFCVDECDAFNPVSLEVRFGNCSSLGITQFMMTCSTASQFDNDESAAGLGLTLDQLR